MKNHRRSAALLALRFLATTLFVFQVSSWAHDPPALAASAIPTSTPAASAPADADPGAGLPAYIRSTTQGNFADLHIGVGYVGGGPYLDEKGVRRNGLHASLSISIDATPPVFQQPDVREGQTLLVGSYRIHVDKIINGDSGKGAVVLHLWSPPKPAASAKGWRSLLGL